MGRGKGNHARNKHVICFGACRLSEVVFFHCISFEVSALDVFMVDGVGMNAATRPRADLTWRTIPLSSGRCRADCTTFTSSVHSVAIAGEYHSKRLLYHTLCF